MMLPKHIYTLTFDAVLAKPVPRFEYVLGKFFGVFLLLLISTLVMSVMFVIALYTKQQMLISSTLREMHSAPPEQLQAALRDIRAHAFTTSLVPGIISIYVKAATIAALTMLLSTFASSSIFTI